MRILYGVSGEGFGHSSRAKQIIPFLLKKGHELMIVTYGQAYQVLKNYLGIKILKVEGIELFFEDKELSLKKTFDRGLKTIGKNIQDFKKIKEKVERFNPDVCISDMEPIVPIIRMAYGLPLICLDNQHRLTHLKLNVPKKYIKDYLIARYAVSKVVSRADFFIILSFVKGGINKNRAKVRIVSPVLRDEVLRLKSKRGEFILVYLTKPNKDILKALRKTKERFVIYVYGMNECKKEGNLEFKKIGGEFLKDLAGCKGIIASAGFTLMSEALYLKKPYFAIPLKGQFEQTLNALFLKKAGFGDYSEEPSEKEINLFLNSLERYEMKLAKHKTKPNEVLKVLGKVLKKFSI